MNRPYKEFKDKWLGKKIDYDRAYGYQCFPEGTYVLMEDGCFKDIKDLLVGDRIVNYDGTRINTVIATNSRVKEIREVDFCGPLKLLVTNEHPFFTSRVQQTHSNRKFHTFSKGEWVNAKDLKHYDLCIIPNQYKIERNSLTNDELFYLGYWLGDGTIFVHNGRTKIRVCSSNKNRKFDVIKNLRISQKEYEYKNQPGTFDHVLNISRHRELVEIIKRCGRGKDKCLPLIFSNDDYKKIIEGYLFADGSLYQGKDSNWRVQTVSKKLAISIQYACMMVGYASNITEKSLSEWQYIQGRKVHCETKAYHIAISLDNYRSKNRLEDMDGNVWTVVNSNKELGREEVVYNITTDGDHTYTANCVGVHNCVDLIKLYADKCLGMGKIGAIGNAKDVPDGKFGKKFTKIKGTDNLMQGDIIVKTNSKYGHIAIVDRILGDKVYVLEQNGSGKNSGSGVGDNAIRVHGYKKSFYQVVLRNTIIIDNYEKEVEYVDVMIKEREQLLKDTKEYKESLTYKK